MPDLLGAAPDLETPEGIRKSIHDIHEAARDLHKRDGKLGSRVDKLVADLKLANQSLTELTAARAVVNTETTPSDAEFRAFVDEDRRTIQWKGGNDEDTGDYAEGLLTAEPINAWHRELQELWEQRSIVRTLTKGQSGSRAGLGVSPRTDRALMRHMKRAPAPVQRLFSDSSGAGASFIPDLLSPVLERELQSARRLEGLLQEWPMEGKELRVPFLTVGLRPYKKAAQSSDDPAQYTSSSISEAQRSFTATGLAVRAQVDEDTSEDSIIPAIPLIRSELIAAITDGVEDCIVNGDTNSTHDDTGLASWDIRSRWGSSGLGGSADHRRSWIGLRARASDVSNTTDQGSTQTYAGFLTARAKLDSPHGSTGDLILVTSPEFYLVKLLGLAEVITVDKLGLAATILTGQLASIGGAPIVLSDFVDKEYNASGIYDNTTKTKTGALLFNRRRFWMGRRRSMMVELDKDITRGLFNMVATVRTLFFTVDSSTKKNVHWGYNLSVS